MTSANTGNPERPEEPISFVDKRKVDPETGEVRQPDAADNGAASSGADGTAVEGSAPAAAAENGAAPGSAGEAETGTAPGDPAAELAERTADLQRLTAEYANYRRRVERDRKTAIDTAKAAVVTELLGVLDDLDRARAHGDLESGPLRSVADKLIAALRKQGLEEFGVEGEPFDPTLHEAVQHEGSGHESVIGVVMRKGYRLGDRVLRHALVGVTDGPSDNAGETDTSDAASAAEASAEQVDAASDSEADSTADAKASGTSDTGSGTDGS
ncbi:nucleotide exchange factor GrpE [Nocardia paucivorans]|uniref:nucleotide exchange factor GrpE n=1 Tax=Nocardia paucivorans TaxID=114259 RepID=UPI0003112C7E|nr:nucleotide exchange factor GrpE [Nocardia paucivorans]